MSPTRQAIPSPVGLGGPQKCPPKYPFPFPPNSCWLNAAGLLPLTSSRPGWHLPTRMLAVVPSLSPTPLLPAPHANCGPGVGEGHPCALVPARRAQAPRSYR